MSDNLYELIVETSYKYFDDGTLGIKAIREIDHEGRVINQRYINYKKGVITSSEVKESTNG